MAKKLSTDIKYAKATQLLRDLRVYRERVSNTIDPFKFDWVLSKSEIKAVDSVIATLEDTVE